VTEPAVSVAFFDPAHGLYGTIRSGVGMVFDGDTHEVVDEPPAILPEGEGWRVELAGRGSVAFDPIAPAADLGPLRTRLCRVQGELGARRLECLGAATEARRPPAWAELDLVRSISAVFDEGHAVFALSQRPRGSPGHGHELTVASLLDGGEPIAVEEARVSTVYDAEGRQRSAGLELLAPGEDLPRRLTGAARTGASLALEGLDVHAAVFGWWMEGREGTGTYELTVREGPQAAA
jgi:hypothetical protein